MKNTPIIIGETYTFYCEMQQAHEPPEKRLRRFTGQTVTVIRENPAERDADTSAMYIVRTADGTEFDAYEEELSGWDYDLGQFFNPDGTYGPNSETWPLANENEHNDKPSECCEIPVKREDFLRGIDTDKIEEPF